MSDNNTTDILKRTNFVNNVVRLVNSILNDDGTAFIMIDGDWGVGKSFVLDKISSELEEENNYFIVKYNCWTNSYYTDPLLAIISTMIYSLEKETIWSSETKNKLYDTFIKLFSSLSLQFISNAGVGLSLSYDSNNLLDRNELIFRNIAKLKNALQQQKTKK